MKCRDGGLCIGHPKVAFVPFITRLWFRWNSHIWLFHFPCHFWPFGVLSFFLSPCKLENFEKAMRCNPSNSQFDSAHISPLSILRKHMEFYIRWRSPICFQLFDRGLPDLVMQSIFTDEYPLIRGLGLKIGFETDAMKMAFEDKKMMAINKIRCCRNQWWMIDPISYLSCVSSGSQNMKIPEFADYLCRSLELKPYWSFYLRLILPSFLK